MSSKKAPSKETKTAAKKPADKKAPAKAVEKAAKATEKKPAAKTATASAAKKTTSKATAKDAKAQEPKKVAAKAAKDTKSVKEPKAAAKPASKATNKAAAGKDVAKASPKVAAKPAVKVNAEPAKPAKAASGKSSPKKGGDAVETKAPATKPSTKGGKIQKTDVDTEEVKSVEVVDVPSKKPAPSKKPVNDYDYAVLLEGVKKLSKAIMFTEVDEQEDRSNKKKMSSEMKNLEMKPTASIRHKTSLAEETQEELTERILKELEEQNLAFEREAASQMCTRCNRNLVSPEFWVDKHLGYCEECAMILKLGQSKEARKVEYQLGGMGDSLDEEDDEIMGPDADDLKAAEDDFAEMED